METPLLWYSPGGLETPSLENKYFFFCPKWTSLSYKSVEYFQLLMAIDVFDRKAFLQAVKNKMANENAEAMENIFTLFKCKPKRIMSDDGSEWKADFQTMLKKYDIYHRTTQRGDHRLLGIIDQFSKTNILYRHFTEKNTTSWAEKLDKIVVSYNDTLHQGLCGLTPNDGNKYWMSVRECQDEKLTSYDKDKQDHIIYYDIPEPDGNHEIYEQLVGKEKVRWKNI